MKLDILTNEELFRLASHQGGYNEYIDKEWKARYQLSFPYRLIKGNNKIYNTILDLELEFDECDKKIVEQAKIIKKCK